MNFFPVFTNIEGRDVYLQGTGHHANEKIQKLLPYGAIIHIFNEDGHEEFPQHPQIIFRGRKLTEEDLASLPVFVITADISTEEAETIYQWCISRNIPINTVDVPHLCTFYFPALITKGAFTMAISTSGKSPAAASILRKNLENQIPDHIDRILDWSEEIRNRLKITHPDPSQRRKILRKAVALALDEDRIPTEEELKKILKEI